MKSESIYWDLPRTLTYNALFNIIVGNRGGGKSFGAIKRCIDNFIRNGEQFGYIRRYKDDLGEAWETIFDHLKPLYPDYEFMIDGRKAYIRLKKSEGEKWTKEEREKCLAGYGFVLSTASNKKSISYPKITTLVFDEFLLEDGLQHYIKNEPTKLLNLYETIARPGTDHPRVVLFMLANAITITNPYFLYWNLKMPTKQDKNYKWIWKHPTRSMIVEDVKNDKFIDKKKNTEFGGIIAGTKYADYSIENKFLLDDDYFIEKKSPSARYYFTFKYKENSFGVWVDFLEGKMWVSKSVDPSFLLVYSTTMQDHRPNTLYIKNLPKSSPFKNFIEYYKNGLVFYESVNLKNLTYDVIKMFI